MKRILVFSLTYYPRFVGGAEVALKEITDRFNPHEYSFDLITLRLDRALPREERIGNIRVFRIGFAKMNPTAEELVRFPMYMVKALYPLMAFRKAIVLSSRHRYDAFWAMMTYMGFPAVLFRLFYRKTPYLLTLQDGDPISHIRDRFRIRIVAPLFRRIFTEAAVVQTISVFLARFAGSMGTRAPIVVVPNGVDIGVFARQYTAQERLATAREIGKKPGETFLVTTSRLVAKNALDDVIQSLAFLPDAVHFVVIGDGPLLGALRDLAARERALSRVHFLRHIDYRNIPRYLAVSDIFVRPSLSEGMGNSFIEAMAAGVPVIGTQEGGIADFLFDPDKNKDREPTGLAVAPRDPRGIARQVKRYLNDPALRQKIIHNARMLAREKYDWNLIARRMEREVFKTLLERQK